jgi:predicted HD phosphohydrolase
MSKKTFLSNKIFDMLYGLYHIRGNNKYMIGENLTQTGHAIQSYRWMKNYGGCQHMQVAAFFHDIGHLVVPYIDPMKNSKDDKHEIAGAEFLDSLGFPKRITEPIRLHVLAKRYLVTTQPETYFNKLSDASKVTFKIQGGCLTQFEISEFRKNIHCKDAITLRICDDKSKNIDDSQFTESEILELTRDIEKIFSISERNN